MRKMFAPAAVNLALLAFLTISGCNSTQPLTQPVSIVGKSVADIVQIMTVDEKIGQMSQVDRRYLDDDQDIKRYALGSLLSGGGSTPAVNSPEAWADMVDEYQAIAQSTRLGIPLIYGIDAVHGHNNVVGATVMPHHIGLGAANNPTLVHELAHITASEVRATGITWTFSPCVAVARDDRWGRTYESYSEDPVITASLGRAAVAGFQGSDLAAPDAIAACVKHYIGDGGTAYGTGWDGGNDRGDTQVDEGTLRALFLPPYVAGIEAGTATIMISYSSWNGEKCHGHGYLINDVLKGELGFKGFVVSDWAGINEIPGDYKSDIVRGIMAGIDMIMIPGDTSRGGYTYHEFMKLFKAAVTEGLIPMERIDDAVTRILTVKKNMGLLDHPWKNDRALLASVGSSEHRVMARQAVRESLVLLKNDSGTLPLSRDFQKIVVTGRGADDVGMQSGGWTISWQGGHGDITPGTSILEGIQAAAGSNTEILHSDAGSDYQQADAIVVVVGEDPYAEYMGDRSDLSLGAEDLELINRVDAAGVPYVVVLISGRPMIVTDVIEKADAFLAAWLPGTEGDGIADVLFGDYTPSGKLPFSWPRTMEQIPINYGDADYDPLFPLGYGLNY